MKISILISTFTLCTLILAPSSMAQTIFQVNALGDLPDSNPGDGICFTGHISGFPIKLHCSLRAAIDEANAHPNGILPDRIFFSNLPINGKNATINLNGDALPDITDPVIIDGTTVAGPVRIFRTSTQFFNGFVLEAGSDGSTIRDMVIGDFWRGIMIYSDDNNILNNHIGTDLVGNDYGNNYGLQVEGDNNIINENTIGFSDFSDIWATGIGHTIQGNFLGTNANSDDLANPIQVRAINVHEGINFTIGGPSEAESNVINSAQIGIDVRYGEGHVIQGNYIGTDPSGLNFGGLENGMFVIDATDVTIGGTVPGSGNTIGFCERGINISFGSDHSLLGNYFGTNDGDEELNIDNEAIYLYDTDNILIGDVSAGHGNTIAHSANGIVVEMAEENTIRGNRIFDNTGSGIDLDNDGATPNDAGDADTGANQLQNYPDISDVYYNNNRELIIFEYALSSDSTIVSYPLTVDFYIADNPATGQGNTYIGTDLYEIQDDIVTFGVDTTGLSINEVDVFVATATDSDGNTSEFSPATDELGSLSIAINAPIDMLDNSADAGRTPSMVPHDKSIANPDRTQWIASLSAYPNPFNPQTTITLSIAEQTHARITVHDILGRQVASLQDGELTPGITHTFSFDGSNLASGTYLLHVKAGSFVETRRLLLFK